MADEAKAAAKKQPRPAWTYRAKRKKIARETQSPMTKTKAVVFDGSYDGSIELNRAERWSRAAGYGYAREIGPSKEPVR